jgi:hypothetical protein
MAGVSRNVQIVVLCEDTQHETFVRRFLNTMGWSTRRMRIEKAPAGRGSGEQFVRKRFPHELIAFRSRDASVRQALIVMMDGDSRGVKARQDELDAACDSLDLPHRQPDERVIILVPTWRIETWFAYLGGDEVDESRRDYPRLSRPRECQKHVDELVAMCRERGLRDPAPRSLIAACAEYNGRFDS